MTLSASLTSLFLPSHMPDSLPISVGNSALYCNPTVAPHSIVGCRVASLPASASQPAPLPLVSPLHLLVVAWHLWAPPYSFIPLSMFFLPPPPPRVSPHRRHPSSVARTPPPSFSSLSRAAIFDCCVVIVSRPSYHLHCRHHVTHCHLCLLLLPPPPIGWIASSTPRCWLVFVCPI